MRLACELSIRFSDDSVDSFGAVKLVGSRQCFQVLPERGVLLDELFLGNRELRSENEVGQCILMENADRVQGDAIPLEIHAVLS